MKYLLLAASVICISSCATTGTSEVRHPSANGCKNFSILETLFWWGDAPLSMGYRLAVDPDTGQGPTTLVVLDAGTFLNPGNPDSSSTFVAAVGDSERTCVVRTRLSECPAAASVYDRLKGQSIPLGFGMDDPTELLVFHAPTYYLEYSDGQSNHNQWRFYGTDHPLQPVIEESIVSLQACIAPALNAYHGR